MRFEKKDFALLVPATLLAIAGLGPDDPWVVGPCLFLSWVVFIAICVIHEGSRRLRTVIGGLITVALFAVGYRRFGSIYHRPNPESHVTQRPDKTAPDNSPPENSPKVKPRPIRPSAQQKLIMDALSLATKVKKLNQDWKEKDDRAAEEQRVRLGRATSDEEKRQVEVWYQTEVRKVNNDALRAYQDRYQSDAIILREKLNDELEPGTKVYTAIQIYKYANSGMILGMVAEDLETAAKTLEEQIKSHPVP